MKLVEIHFQRSMQSWPKRRLKPTFVIHADRICPRLAQAAMAQRDTSVSDLCKELGIERVTLYRYVGPKGELRDHGKHVLGLT